MEHKKKREFSLFNRRFAWFFLCVMLVLAGIISLAYGYFARNMFLPPLGAVLLVAGGGILLGKRGDVGDIVGRTDSALQPASGEVLCLRDYPKSQGGLKEELVPLKDILPDTDIWEDSKTGKKYYYQVMKAGKNPIPMKLSNQIRFSPETVHRIRECPAKELNSLQFGMLERLAPFAPVAALLIGFFLFVVVLG